MISITVSLPTPSTTTRWVVALLPAAMTAVLAIDMRIRGSEEILVHGIADEAAHVLTALVIFAAIRALGIPASWVAAVIGAVALDAGHIANLANAVEPIAGSSRSGEHSLGPAVVAIALGLLIPPVRVFLVSLGVGMLTHLFRDAATGTVPLLWPWSDGVFHLRYAAYLFLRAGFATVASAVVALGYEPRARRVVATEPGATPLPGRRLPERMSQGDALPR